MEVYRIDFSLEQIEILREALDIASSWHKMSTKFPLLKKFLNDTVKRTCVNA